MKCGIFSQNEWLFTDSRVDEGKGRADLFLLKKQTGAFQVIISDIEIGQPVAVTCQGLDGVTVTAYREKDVCVNRNTNDVHNGALTTEDWDVVASRHRVRKAPYRTYDALVPIEGLVSEASQEVYYVTLCPNESAKSDSYEGIMTFVFGEKSISFLVGLQVGNKTLPEQTLKLTNWYSYPNMAWSHGLKYGSDEHVEMVKKYFDLLNECGNNVFWCTFDLTKATEENGKITFDFSEPKKRAQLALDCGAKILEWAPIISRPTWEDPPFLVWDYRNDTRGPNVLSTGGRKYFTAFLTAFNDMLTEMGWRDISIVHVSDEPKELCASDFRIICGIVRKYLPGIKLVDAIEIFFLQDALDIYVPKDHYFQMNKNDFEDLRDDRNEIWFYTCNMPGGRWLNRFIDSPLLNTRLLHWGNYRFNLTGYLHWGFNHIANDQDPFEQTSRNAGLPAGDTHIVYPYGDKVLRSLRFMQMKCGVEDYEILRALSLSDKTVADKICRRAMYAFDEYITDVEEFDKIQKELVAAYDAI
ncbi:MAG: DUF4091 domain-containing protein [Clostridia bacterium]|nr:DUF4091 domain-containing protein [Clostridia bacterium]